MPFKNCHNVLDSIMIDNNPKMFIELKKTMKEFVFQNKQ